MQTSLKNINFNELEFHEIGAWPMPIKVVAIIVLCLLSIAAAYFLTVKTEFEQYNFQHSKQMDTRKEFAVKYNKAANLNLYKEQMVEMTRTFNELLRQLPSEGQVPALMEEITSQAAAAGLGFKLIRPGQAIDKGFYKELPIKMVITGSYHGFGQFISGLSKMPRIVTLHDFDIKPGPVVKDAIPGAELVMDVDAKTYWYTTTTDTGAL